MFHPYCFFCYLLPRQAAGERRSEELRRADKRLLKKDERDRRSDDSHCGGRDKPTGREKKNILINKIHLSCVLKIAQKLNLQAKIL